MDEQNQQNGYWSPEDESLGESTADYEAVDQLESKVAPEAPKLDTITWTAKENTDYNRGAWWFVTFILITAALVLASTFLLKSVTFSVLIVVMAFSLFVYVRRPAKDMSYILSPQEGLYIDETLYRFEDIKSFGVIQDSGEPYIMLIPRKRFSPATSVFFPQDIGADVVDALGAYIPIEDLKSDFVDKLVRKLRL